MASHARSAMSLCRSCRTASVQARAFSSTPSFMVGPESPKFIDIPPQLQTFHPHKPEVKGTLPVPREVFPARRPDKPTQAYADEATPEPSKETNLKPGDPHYEYVEWKRKMATIRRQNLREGLQQLYSRKKSTEHAKAKRSNAKISQRETILTQGKREDERLMEQSTISLMKPTKTPILPNPNAEERLETSRARYAAKQQEKLDEKFDHLHSLYMNARTFIINEEQLKAEIDRVFPDGENPEWANDVEAGTNIWNRGVPSTIESLVRAGKDDDRSWSVEQKRVKKIAETLTGGAI
ncbi:hypothetical protein FQN53_003682 [Emmonsiellopsis sp. PD_33]|nr:hypothetical protein FQN53_003682 [Emmonsiellopsis sp. PD_33]